MADAKKKYVLQMNVRFKGKRLGTGDEVALTAAELAQFPAESLKETTAKAADASN